MDFKKKYLKYKIKYMTLLNGGDIDDYYTFTTKRNNGTSGFLYRNQCFWLSILDYLNDVLNLRVSLEEIRIIASRNNASINNNTEEFDFEQHRQALENVLNEFNLTINLYVSGNFLGNGEQVLINSPEVFGNPGPNIVSIVHNGYHFELITSIRENKLYNSVNTLEFSKYKPKLNLVLGVDENIVNKMNVKLNNLVETVNNYNFIHTEYKKEKEIVLNSIKILKQINFKEESDLEIQKIMKQSSIEEIRKLEIRKNEIQEDIDEIFDLIKKNKLEINKLLFK